LPTKPPKLLLSHSSSIPLLYEKTGRKEPERPSPNLLALYDKEITSTFKTLSLPVLFQLRGQIIPNSGSRLSKLFKLDCTSFKTL
jgi:hypothetical protein